MFPSTRLCRAPDPPFDRQRIELPDGDFVEADWVGPTGDADAPLLVLLHGLEGSSESSYARMMMQFALDAGWAGVVLHFRGCGGSSNRLPRRYHAGDTGDVRVFLTRLRERFPQRTLLAVGYSLGGNVLLKLLGERREADLLDAAVGVSVPYDLNDSARALSLGASRFYQRFLLGNMRRAMTAKYRPEFAPFDWHGAMAAVTFREFDDLVTAPLHGFRDVDDYYGKSSCKQYLPGIRIPTLLLGAIDDPFLLPESYPAAGEVAASVKRQFTPHGGHVGFVYGTHPLRPRYWLPERIMGFFVDELGI